jgi:hypothetical protein
MKSETLPSLLFWLPLFDLPLTSALNSSAGSSASVIGSTAISTNSFERRRDSVLGLATVPSPLLGKLGTGVSVSDNNEDSPVMVRIVGNRFN